MLYTSCVDSYKRYNLFGFIGNNNCNGNSGRRNLFMEYRSSNSIDYSFTRVDNFLFSSLLIGRLCKFTANGNSDSHATNCTICFGHIIQYFNMRRRVCYIYCHANKWWI